MSKAANLLEMLNEGEKEGYTAFVKLAWDKTLKKTCATKSECQAWIDKMDKKYPGDQLVATWINPAKVGAGDTVKVPNTGPIKVGDRVQVSFGSGLDSDRIGIVTGFKGKEAVIKDDKGNTFTMFTNRLFHPK